MFEIPLTPEWLVAAIAFILALVFDWFPGIAKWFDGLTNAVKRIVTIVLLVVVSAAVFGLGCVGILQLTVACTWVGGFDMLKVLIAAIAINQSAHTLFKPSVSFRQRMFKK